MCLMKPKAKTVFVLATLLSAALAAADDDFCPTGGWLPPEPPAGFSSSSGGRPPEPPDGFMHGRGGRDHGERRGSMRGGGPRGGRGDDPSDASIYSGVKTVGAQGASFADVSIDSSSTKNAAPLYVKDAGKATVKGGRLTSSVSGANAVLVIGKGSVADVSDLVIETSADSSRGLYAFQGGVITARNVRISTKGAHCAAMATDRGEGTVTVAGGVLNTAGDGSPCIYSTGTLAARKVTGCAKGSEAMVIEGRNSITLEDARLRGERKCGAMLYQSFSGDAREGVARLAMKRSTLSAATGPVFFVTNTRAEIVLDNCVLQASAGAPLLSAGAARWGRSGSNGGKVTLKAVHQNLKGDIVADALSEVTLEFGEGTPFTGAVNAANTAKSVTLKLARGAKVSLTDDSHITKIVNADPTGANIATNGHSLK